MIKGSCCCGTVQFELTGTQHDGYLPLQPMPQSWRCTLVFVESETFQINKGRDLIATYLAEPPYKYDRCFCSICSSALGEVPAKQFDLHPFES